MNLNGVKIVSKWKVSVETDDVVIDVISSQETIKNYEFYMNGIKKDFDESQEREILEHILKNIDQHELGYVIANEDYNRVYRVVEFDDLIYYFDNDFELMKNELLNTLNIFIEQEHYEKCKVINDLLKQIK